MQGIGTYLANQFGAEWLILFYLIYQFTYGKVSKLYNTVRSTIPVLMALSTQVDGVDEQAAAETLDTKIATPGQLLDHDKTYTDEEVESMAQIVKEQNGGD